MWGDKVGLGLMGQGEQVVYVLLDAGRGCLYVSRVRSAGLYRPLSAALLEVG